MKRLFYIVFFALAAVAFAAIPSIKNGWDASGNRTMLDSNTGDVVMTVGHNNTGVLIHEGITVGTSGTKPTFSAAGLYLVEVKYEPHWGLPVTSDILLPDSLGL